MRTQHYTMNLLLTVQLPQADVTIDTTPVEDRAQRMVERMTDDLEVEEYAIGVYDNPPTGWYQTIAVVVVVAADVTKEKASDIAPDGPMLTFLQEHLADLVRRYEDDARIVDASSDVIMMPPVAG